MGNFSGNAVRKDSVLTTANMTEFDYASIDEAFPDVDPGVAPFGAKAVFQIRHPKTKTKGGIILDPSARSTEHYRTVVAKVVAVGPLCFKSRRVNDDGSEELADWPEGKWFKVGDFVRVPLYGGDRFTVSFNRKETRWNQHDRRDETDTVEDQCVFAIFRAADILASIKDPLKHKAYLD